MHVFYAGDGINKTKLNDNFKEVQNSANANEQALSQIAAYALHKDGSNLTQDIINKFNKKQPNILPQYGEIYLSDNSVNFLNPTGNVTIILPSVVNVNYSHTIVLIVQGSSYSVKTVTDSRADVTKHLYNDLHIDTTKTYNLMYVYNPIDMNWYYSLTQ